VLGFLLSALGKKARQLSPPAAACDKGSVKQRPNGPSATGRVRKPTASGYAFSNPRGGYEYPLVLTVIYAAIFFRGAGRCSIDRMIGKEF
jgi:hypothetical protein